MIDKMNLDTLLDSTLIGIYILDGDGNYIYANASWLKMVDGLKSDLPKLNAYQMVKEGYVPKSAAITAFEQKKRVTMVNKVDNWRRGNQYTQLVTATPIFDSYGEIEYMVVEMLNLKTLEEQLETHHMGDNIDANVELETGTGLKRYMHGSSNPELVAASDKMEQVIRVADDVAKTDSTVLLTGETGTGKDVVAHYIHNHSRRNEKEMVILNCAALPENLMESELFGYVKGAYTGALNTGKEGLLQQAHGGTLFLDEINSMPLSIQGKLLRVLENGRVKKLGALKEDPVDFRLIAATNQDLQKCVETGNFRADLYYRLAVVPLEIPPLRERKNDIIPLALRFLDEYCRKYERTKLMAPAVLQQLLQYDWPGNIRELKNVMERIVVTSSSSAVEIKQLPTGFYKGHEMISGASLEKIQYEDLLAPSWEPILQLDPEHFSLKGYLEFCEKQVIDEVMKKCGSTRKAAKILKVDQSTIVRKKQKLDKIVEKKEE